MNVKFNGVLLVLGHDIRNRSGSSSGFEDQQQIHVPIMVSLLWKLRLHLGVSADDMKKSCPLGQPVILAESRSYRSPALVSLSTKVGMYMYSHHQLTS